MRAETLRTIASIASHAATLFHSKLSSACKKKSKRRKKKRMKERGKDAILEESFQSVFDAFQNEQTYEKFKKHVVTREVLSRRKSEIEETKGSQDSEEDLLDDWIVLEEESSEVDEGEKEKVLKVAVVKVLVSAYEKIRRDEGENEIIKEREFFDAFNASLKSWSDTDKSFEKHWKRLLFVRNVCNATSAMQHRATRKVAKIVSKHAFKHRIRHSQ